MTGRQWAMLASGLVLASVLLWALLGAQWAPFAGLLLLLPGAKKAVERVRTDAAIEHAVAQREQAQAQRDELKRRFDAIERATAQGVADAGRRWEEVGQAPTEADMKEMLEFFEKRRTL